MKRIFASALVTAGALSLAACSSKPPPRFEVVVKVQGDPGEPLPGAVVLFQGKQVGKTNEKGRTVLGLKGVEGQTYAFTVQCPSGYKSPSQPTAVTLRRIAEPSKRPEYLVDCPPTTRDVVVAVRADNGPNLPVVYLGRKVATTDASGAADVLLKMPPNQSFKLMLDTSGDADKRLRPQNPTATFDVKEQDDIFVFDQTFKRERPHYHYYHHRVGPTPL